MNDLVSHAAKVRAAAALTLYVATVHCSEHAAFGLQAHTLSTAHSRRRMR
jgi:hypothetical protein